MTENPPNHIVASQQQLKLVPGSCPKCQNPIESDANFCPHCGAQLTGQNQHPAPQQAAAESPPEAPQSLIAPKLSPIEASQEKPEPTEAKDEKASSITISAGDSAVPCVCSCGKRLPDGAVYCLDCGAKVGQPRMKHLLVHKTDAGNGRNIPIGDHELTIGKSQDCNLVITDDAYVSRHHARIYKADGMLFLEDMGSANGTFLRPRRPIILEVGDEILIGANVFRLEEVQE